MVNGGAPVTLTSGSTSSALPLQVGANSIEVTITSTDLSTTLTYTLSVLRPAELSGLVLSEGSLSPAFNAGTDTYIVSEVSSTNSITVTPTGAGSEVVISVQLGSGVPETVESGTASSALPLNVGENTITITITSIDGKSSKTYTLTVTRSAGLGTILISVGTLSPAFDPAITSYSATVGSGDSSLQITPSSGGGTIQAVVNGSAPVTLTSGIASGNLPLKVGENIIEITVTSVDLSSTMTYTLTVLRPAELGGLVLSAGSLLPSFAPGTAEYSVDAANSDNAITITPTGLGSEVTITVQLGSGLPETVNSGEASSPLPLTVGENTITVSITSTDGKTAKSYTLMVTRATALGTLDISIGSLTPAFDPSVTDYTADISYTDTSLTITPAQTGGSSVIEIQLGSGAYVSVPSGSSSPELPLVSGTNTVRVRVTSSDGKTSRIYTILIKRAAGLDSLLLNVGTLSPSFNPLTLSGYTSSVVYAQNSIAIIPSNAGSTQTVSVRVNSGTWVPLTLGQASSSLPLIVGGNLVEVRVSSQDSSTSSTYILTVTRQPSSTNANLGSISIPGLTFTPAFNPNITSGYSANVPSGTSAVQINAVPGNRSALMRARINSGAWINLPAGSLSANLPLILGTNILEVQITAEDGATVKTYTFTVIRSAGLAGLQISAGSLSPAFTPHHLYLQRRCHKQYQQPDGHPRR